MARWDVSISQLLLHALFTCHSFQISTREVGVTNTIIISVIFFIVIIIVTNIIIIIIIIIIIFYIAVIRAELQSSSPSWSPSLSSSQSSCFAERPRRLTN